MSANTLVLRARLLSAIGVTSLAFAAGCQNGTIEWTTGDDTGDPVGGDDTGTVDTSDTGTPTIEPTCAVAPIISADDYFATTNPGEMSWLVCLPLPEDGADCEAATNVNSWEILALVLGNSDPDFCGWGGNMVCGPELTIADACCYEMNEIYEWCEGRPFTIGDEVRVAALSTAASWCADTALSGRSEAAAAEWAAAAQDEHASIASFARFAMQLMSLGAPADLVAGATRAQADEIAHARAAFGIASALAGRPIGAGALDISGALSGGDDLRSVLLATIREGCVGETLAAAHAGHAADLTEEPVIAAALRVIADDEGRHAALAWRFVRWALDRDPSLRVDARRAFDEALAWRPAAEPSPEAAELARFGRLDKAGQAALTARVQRDVIAPCAAALFATAGSEAPAA